MTRENSIYIALLAAIAALLGVALLASVGFQSRYVGNLIEDVPDAIHFRTQWQELLAATPDIRHPAVIHYQPQGCLCFALSAGHAGQITDDALASGFAVYQLNTDRENLGQTLNLSSVDLPLGPLIAITRADGSLRYAGAYSDGIRCNTGNSLVSSFISNTAGTSEQTVIGLDATICRCLNTPVD